MKTLALVALAWSRVVVVDAPTVTVVRVDQAELARLVAKPTSRDLGIARRAPHGYAELRRNIKTGAYTCTVYLPPNATEETLAHELKHCEGWVHP